MAPVAPVVNVYRFCSPGFLPPALVSPEFIVRLENVLGSVLKDRVADVLRSGFRSLSAVPEGEAEAFWAQLDQLGQCQDADLRAVANLLRKCVLNPRYDPAAVEELRQPHEPAEDAELSWANPLTFFLRVAAAPDSRRRKEKYMYTNRRWWRTPCLMRVANAEAVAAVIREQLRLRLATFAGRQVSAGLSSAEKRQFADVLRKGGWFRFALDHWEQWESRRLYADLAEAIRSLDPLFASLAYSYPAPDCFSPAYFLPCDHPDIYKLENEELLAHNAKQAKERAATKESWQRRRKQLNTDEQWSETEKEAESARSKMCRKLDAKRDQEDAEDLARTETDQRTPVDLVSPVLDAINSTRYHCLLGAKAAMIIKKVLIASVRFCVTTATVESMMISQGVSVLPPDLLAGIPAVVSRLPNDSGDNGVRMIRWRIEGEKPLLFGDLTSGCSEIVRASTIHQRLLIQCAESDLFWWDNDQDRRHPPLSNHSAEYEREDMDKLALSSRLAWMSEEKREEKDDKKKAAKRAKVAKNKEAAKDSRDATTVCDYETFRFGVPRTFIHVVTPSSSTKPAPVPSTERMRTGVWTILSSMHATNYAEPAQEPVQEKMEIEAESDDDLDRGIDTETAAWMDANF